MLIEVCQILGKDSQSSLHLKRNLQRDVCGPGGSLQKFKQLPDLTICGLKHGPICRKQLGPSKNRISTMLVTERHFFIDPKDGEFKETIKNARKKLEIPMEAAVPCKMRTKKRSNKSRETDDETKGPNKSRKTKHACIVEAHESTRKASGIMSTKRSGRSHRGERVPSDETLQSGAQVYSLCLKRWKFKMWKKQRTKKESEKLEKLPAWVG